MTALTPEQWRELDDAEKAFAALDDAVYLSWESEHRIVTRLRDRLTTHARTLIDAARPMCPRCSGSGIIETAGCVCAGECHVCDGTGWAA